MSPDSRLGRFARVSLVFAMALASWSCCTIAKMANAYCNGVVLVIVSQGGSVTLDKFSISQSGNQEILWKAAPGFTVNSIDIKVESGQEPPFKKCSLGHICSIQCDSDGICASGPINPSLDPRRQANNYYAYKSNPPGWVPPDPGFIIHP